MFKSASKTLLKRSVKPAVFSQLRLVSGSTFVADVEYQSRIQQLKNYLQEDGRAQIAVPDFVSAAKEKAQLTDEQAQILLDHFHHSGVFLHYKNNEQLKHVVILKPEVLTQTLFQRLDQGELQPKLQAQLETIKALQKEFNAMHAVKFQLDKKAESRINTYFYGAVAYLSAQMGFYAKLTWVDYGWDVVEPITYFTSFTVILASYIYYSIHKREYTYEDLRGMMIIQRQFKEYKKNNFNIDRYLELQEELTEAMTKFEDDCVEVYGRGNIPAQYTEVLAQFEDSPVTPVATPQQPAAKQ